ncbi:MAG: class I SAM-dependent methyltransferase [Actinomycetota bacterium]
MTQPEFVFDDALPLTGERTAPGIPEENYWFQRHVIAYEFAASLVSGMRVLDAGCGEGYGTQILASVASSVVGIDLERSVVERAARRYSGVHFEAASLESLHFEPESFDAVVTLQVIEHMRSPSDFVGEIARVLKPGGLLVIATPNRLTFSPSGIRNPFHTVEFSMTELRSLIERAFKVEQALGAFHGTRIKRFERWNRVSLPEKLISTPAPEWSGRLRSLVADVTSKDFELRGSDLDRSLDLVLVARR